MPLSSSKPHAFLACWATTIPKRPRKLVLKFNERATAGSDVHYLIVLSRVATTFTTNIQATVVNALLSLDRKLEGQQMRNKQYWSTRRRDCSAIRFTPPHHAR